MSAQIDILNKSTALADADLKTYVDAIQIQVSRDFAPAWGIDAQLAQVQAADPSHWQMVVLDNSDQAGALGYHDLSSTGLPIGYVFAKTDLDNGCMVSVTLSHEILEMLGDPNVNLCAQVDDKTFIAYEMSDAVEADTDGYQINNVQVSDFVLPAYFEPSTPGPFDYRQLLTSRMPSLRPQGYSNIWTSADGWSQINGELIESPKAKYLARPRLGSRRDRRMRPRHQWLNSLI